uniref:(northern house mosquito) hypothetical protein n=1 Tax=Culex pipiens TaxID=7175 RepID=A0A8D8JBJ4_CULPI
MGFVRRRAGNRPGPDGAAGDDAPLADHHVRHGPEQLAGRARAQVSRGVADIVHAVCVFRPDGVLHRAVWHPVRQALASGGQSASSPPPRWRRRRSRRSQQCPRLGTARPAAAVDAQPQSEHRRDADEFQSRAA